MPTRTRIDVPMARVVRQSCTNRCAAGADGQEAIECLDQAQPDVVITDLAMPGLEGVDTTAHVRRHHTDVSVLVLTSAPYGQQAAAALAAGAHRILGKSLDLTDLVKAVRAAYTRT